MKRRKGFNGELSIVLPRVILDWEQNNPLVSSLYVTAIGYYPHAENHYCERKKPINQYVLLYCVNGKGWYEIDGIRHKLNNDQYIILPILKPHSYGADDDDPWTIYWIHFNGSHAEYYVSENTDPIDIKPRLNSRIYNRNNLFEEIFNTILNGSGIEDFRYASSLLHFYLASMLYLIQFRDAPSQNLDSEIITTAIHYMKENLHKHLSIDDIANYLGYSPSYLSSLFKQKIGESPIAYFNRQKILRTCFLLETTKMKINQVCYKVGIDDCHYYSRLFKKITGKSPEQFRKEIKNKSAV